MLQMPQVEPHHVVSIGSEDSTDQSSLAIPSCLVYVDHLEVRFLPVAKFLEKRHDMSLSTDGQSTHDQTSHKIMAIQTWGN